MTPAAPARIASFLFRARTSAKPTTGKHLRWMLLHTLLFTPAMPVSLEKSLYGNFSDTGNSAWRMRSGRRRALRETYVDALRAVGSCKYFVVGTKVKVHPNTPNSRQSKGESYKEIYKLQIGDLFDVSGVSWYGPTEDFTVIDARPRAGYGDYLYLDINGQQVGMAHFAEVNADILGGQTVPAGTYLGRTQPLMGKSTGRHIHIEDPDLLRSSDKTLKILQGE